MNFKKTKSYKSFLKSKYSCIKCINYFNIYDELFKKYRNKKITFVEIGIFSGGSLFMWRDYFGKKARIIGIDLNPESKRFEKYGFEILTSDTGCPSTAAALTKCSYSTNSTRLRWFFA